MNIFRKRPLSLILCIMLSGFFLFTVNSIVLRIIIASLSLIALIFIFVHPILRKKALYKILIILFIVAYLFSALYFEVLFYPKSFNDEEITVIGEVTDVDKDAIDYATVLTIKTEFIDNERSEHLILTYLYNSYTKVDVGYKIFFKSTLEKFDDSKDFNLKNYYTSRGISALTNISTFEVIDITNPPLSYKLKQMRQEISDYAADVSDEESGGLLSALLLGERNYMNPLLNSNFNKTGISHILALSGMHLVMLSYALSFVLSLFQVNKKHKSIIIMIFVILFMALTGFPSSVMRAGFMLIISSTLFLMNGCKDNITSLFIAFFLIILIKPYAILDIGLWLSALATLGILVYSEYREGKLRPEGHFQKLVSGLKDSLFISVFAISSTYALCVLTFDTTSSLSVLTTLIFGFLTEIYTYVGLFVLAFGKIIPIGGLLIPLRKFIESAVGLFASIPYTYFSTNSWFIKLLGICLTIFIFAFFILKLKNKKCFLVLIAGFYIIVNAVGMSVAVYSSNIQYVAYEDNAGERFLLASDGNISLIDLNSGSGATAYATGDFLLSNNITEVDNYMILTYSKSTSEQIQTLLSKFNIRKILLPLPQNKYEENIIIKAYGENKIFNPNIEFYRTDDSVKLGTYEFLKVSAPSENKDKYYSFAIKSQDKLYGYISPGALKNDKLTESLIYASDNLIFGSYGYKFNENYYVDIFNHKTNYILNNTKKLIVLNTNEETVIKYGKRIRFK